MRKIKLRKETVSTVIILTGAGLLAAIPAAALGGRFQDVDRRSVGW